MRQCHFICFWKVSWNFVTYHAWWEKVKNLITYQIYLWTVFIKWIAYVLSGSHKPFYIVCTLLVKSKEITKQLQNEQTTFMAHVASYGGRHHTAGKWNECCFRLWFCIVRLYWAGDNLGLWDERMSMINRWLMDTILQVFNFVQITRQMATNCRS